jgi:dUTP pyrophosphatase
MPKKKGFRPVLKRGEVIKFVKVRNVKDPEYGTRGSVGIDFFVPEEFDKFNVEPNESVLIPSGIKARLPVDTGLFAHPKSSIVTQKGLATGADTIDWDYEGEIHIHLFNYSESATSIEAGEKIAQFVLMPVINAKMFNVESEHNLYKDSNSERGEGGFGSTN